MKLAFILLN